MEGMPRAVSVPWTPIDTSSGGPGLVLFSSCSLAGKRLLALIKKEVEIRRLPWQGAQK